MRPPIDFPMLRNDFKTRYYSLESLRDFAEVPDENGQLRRSF